MENREFHNKPEPAYFTPEELAQYLNVSKRLLHKWRRRLPVVKMGRLNRYPRNEIRKRLISGTLLKPL